MNIGEALLRKRDSLGMKSDEYKMVLVGNIKIPRYQKSAIQKHFSEKAIPMSIGIRLILDKFYRDVIKGRSDKR